MTEILKLPVTDSSAWTRNRFTNDESWIHTLSHRETAELLAATESVKNKGPDVAGFDPELFPIPKFGAALSRFRDELENGRGVVLIRGLPVAGLDRRCVLLMYSGIGAHLGRVISRNSRGDRIRQVADLRGRRRKRTTPAAAPDVDQPGRRQAAGAGTLRPARHRPAGGGGGHQGGP